MAILALGHYILCQRSPPLHIFLHIDPQVLTLSWHVVNATERSVAVPFYWNIPHGSSDNCEHGGLCLCTLLGI